MKGKITKFLLFLAIIMVPICSAKAMDAKTGDSIYVTKGEIVSGNLFAAGETITIDGNISGDLIAAAQTINVNGRVDGDVIALAQTITINGEVGGNIRVAGTAIALNGPVARNVNVFGSNITQGENSVIGWDVFAAGATLENRGLINGSLSGSVGHALIAGQIAKNLNLKISENNSSAGLVISPTAAIGGDVIYTAGKTAQISEQSVIRGQIKQQAPPIKNNHWFAAWAWSKLYSIFCALVIGLLLIFGLKKITVQLLKSLDARALKSLLPGAIIMFALPPLSLFLALTIIGLPLALIIMASWLVMLYVAKILAALFAGEFIFKKIFNKQGVKPIWSLVLGVVVCWLLFAIPFVGWIIGLIAIWLGLGGIWLYASNQYRHL